MTYPPSSYPPAGGSDPNQQAAGYPGQPAGYPAQQPYSAPGYAAAPGYPAAAYGQPAYVAAPTTAAPPDYLGWCIVAILFFWPLAIAAFIQRGKIQPAWMSGQYAVAQKASADTKKYGVIALIIGLCWIGLVIILSVTAAATVSSYY